MRALLLLLLVLPRLFAGSFTVASYNLEFYVDQPVFNGVQPKSAEARRVVVESIRAIEADVIALQEVGTTNALNELRAALETSGLHYPHWEHLRARDTALHLAFLSKHPIVARRGHRNEGYLHQGRRFYVARGFSEIEVELPNRARVTLITAHLKSQRVVAGADQQALREEEALLLREKIDTFFARSPQGNLVVLGDLNDRIPSRTLRTILGRGKNALFDTRPSEGLRNAASQRSGQRTRDVVWTHFYALEETYSRIDYILISPALRARWQPEKTFIHAHPEWGTGSDHRPLVAGFDLN